MRMIAKPMTVNEYWQMLRRACVDYRNSNKTKPRVVKGGGG